MHSSLSVVVLWQTHSMFIKARRDIMLLHSHCLRSCKGKMPSNFCNSIIILLELLSVPVLPCKKQYCISSFLIDTGALSRHFHCTNQITLLSFFTVIFVSTLILFTDGQNFSDETTYNQKMPILQRNLKHKYWSPT